MQLSAFETRGRSSAARPHRASGGPALRQSLRAFLMLCAGAAPFPAHASGPAQWVLDFNRRLAARLGSAELAASVRAERFAAILDLDVDADAFGRSTLEWRWRAATIEERRVFRRGLRGFLVHGLAGRLVGFGQRQIIVVAVRVENDASTVVTEVPGESGTASLHVAWRLTPWKDNWRLSDVVVEDVSLASVLRAQFEAVLEGTDAGLAPVLAMLRQTSEG